MLIYLFFSSFALIRLFTIQFLVLDKYVKEWEIYIILEATIKNMITAMRIINELQNPAIRQRHWEQLMAATKVRRK